MPEYKIWRTSDPEGEHQPFIYAHWDEDALAFVYEIESLGDLFFLLARVQLPLKFYPDGGIEICDQERSEEQ